MAPKRPAGRPLVLAVVALAVTTGVLAGVAPVAAAGTAVTAVGPDSGDAAGPILVDPQPTDPDGDGDDGDSHG
jgi:hypothetical protein